MDPQIPYHPTLKLLVTRWTQQTMTPRALNFLMYIGVLHGDERLTAWALERGADINAKPEKFYLRFLSNLKTDGCTKH